MEECVPTRRRLMRAGLAGGVLAAPGLARAQAAPWPGDRVTIVTSLPAGSTVDLVTRLLGGRLAQVWGQPVVVDNRGGGNGVVACEAVARARPDGRTLLATSAMTHAANPALYGDRLPYHPLRDFAAISQYGRSSPFALVASRTLGTATLAEFTERLRARPGGYDYGWGSVPSHVASQLFRLEAGVDIVHVGYRGNQAAFPDLVSGRIAMMSIDVIGAKPLIDRGEVHALALSDTVRHPALPALPTAAEAGLPGFRFTTWSGLYAPSGTPPAILDRIAGDIADAVALPELRARLEAMGSLPRPTSSPAEFQAFTATELEAWGRIIRQAGIRAE
jgi:tripartite-type tricarboxylate transporter receptor subunit TctC